MYLPLVAREPSGILEVGGSGSYRSIQAAIEAAKDGDLIRIAQGTYTENLGIYEAKAIWLQGGWNEDFSARSTDSSLTRVDGGGQGSVFDIAAGSGQRITVGIESLTIRNGMAEVGGGIRVVASDPGTKIVLLLTNSTVTGNTAGNRGGGIYIQSSHTSLVEAVLRDNALSDNTTNNEGGGLRVESRMGGSVTVTAVHNRITNNMVTHSDTERPGGDDGGGIMAVTSHSGSTTLILTGNTITDNQAGYGGAMLGYAWGTEARLDITMNQNILAGNLAREMGGAIFSCSGVTDPGTVDNPGGSVTWNLTNNTITGNTAQKIGDVITLYSGSTFGDGGAIQLTSRNDIIWGNTYPDGKPLLDVDAIVQPGKAGSAAARVFYSVIGLMDARNGGTVTPHNTIDADPLFLDPASQDFRLRDGSPAVDAGDPDPASNDGHRPPGKGTERGDIGAFGGPGNGVWSDPFTINSSQ